MYHFDSNNTLHTELHNTIFCTNVDPMQWIHYVDAKFTIINICRDYGGQNILSRLLSLIHAARTENIF